MLIIQCPQCNARYDAGPGTEEALEDLERMPSGTSLKVACPACGQWVRLPGKVPIATPNAPPKILKEMMAQSRLIDQGDPSRIKSATAKRRDRNHRDDDDEWDDRPRRAKRRKDHTVVIVIAVLGSLFLLVALAVGVVLYLRDAEARRIQEANLKFIEGQQAQFAEMQKQQLNKFNDAAGKMMDGNGMMANIDANRQSQQKVEEFMNQIRLGKTKEAYAFLSQRLAKKYPDLESFEAFIEANPIFKSPSRPFPADPFSKDTGTRFFTLTMASPRGISRFSIGMVKVDSEWKVEQLELTP